MAGDESSVTRSVARYYDSYGWNSQSGAIGEDLTFRRFSPAFRAYSKASTARVLDAANGVTGSIVFVGSGDMPDNHVALANRFEAVTCLDISKAGLELSRAKLGDQVAYVAESIVDTSLPDNSFDFVFCAHVLYHISQDQQEAAVRQMIRLAKPGGRIVIVYANPNSPFRLPGRIAEQALALMGKSQKPEDSAALYYHDHPLRWFNRFKDGCALRLLPWEVVNSRFADSLIRSGFLAARFFALARWMERKVPDLAARLWHFPIIVLDKPRD